MRFSPWRLGKISKGKLAEYVGKNYSEIPSFLKKYGYDENEDYSFAYRTAMPTSYPFAD